MAAWQEGGLTVSIIVPCRNEQESIRGLLDGISRQSYPHRLMEVIIADGASEDRTRELIEEFQTSADFRLRIVHNPERIIPAGLNRALKAAEGEIVVRLDAHSIPYPDYVERCVELLSEGRGENVGGVWEIRPGGRGLMARGIAAAASHPLGAGDARYRLGGKAGSVETVPFGAFYRRTLERLGGFDTDLLANEDYELNVRLRESGGVVWLDPEIRSIYRARRTLRALGRQYWGYGYWKWKVVRRYPGSLRWRQVLPPLFVLMLFSGALASCLIPAVADALGVMVGTYGLVLLAGGCQSAWQRGDSTLVVGFPLGVAVMQLCWGTGFLWSMLSTLLRARPTGS